MRWRDRKGGLTRRALVDNWILIIVRPRSEGTDLCQGGASHPAASFQDYFPSTLSFQTVDFHLAFG